MITRENGSRVYAGTLTFFELIEEESICNAMQSLQTMYDADSMNSKNTLLSTLGHSLPSNRSNNRSFFSNTSRTNLNSTSNNTNDINATPIIIKSHNLNLEKTNEESENYVDESNLLSTPNLDSSLKLASNFENVLKSSNGSYMTSKVNTLKMSQAWVIKIVQYSRNDPTILNEKWFRTQFV